MKLTIGDIIVPEHHENVFENLQRLIQDTPEYVHIQPMYEIIDVHDSIKQQKLYVILGMPTLFESELSKVFGKFKVI